MITSNRRSPIWGLRAMLTTTAVSALMLAGCSGGSTPSSGGSADSGSVAGEARAGEAKAGGAGAGAAPAAGTDKPGAVSVAPKLAKTATIALRVTNLTSAAAKVRAVATGLQGSVVNESIGTGPGADPKPYAEGGEPFGGFGMLTLSVPAVKLDTALDQLSKPQLGTVLSRATSSNDVTSQYIDTESRVKTMRASVDRVRALMAQAKDIGQVVALESELSRRQADLESLESQLASLKGDVERSTVTVSLSTPGHEPSGDGGFLAGLSAGWDAFQNSVKGLLTAVGAALPFAVLLAILGFSLLSWLRRRKGRAVHGGAQGAV